LLNSYKEYNQYVENILLNHGPLELFAITPVSLSVTSRRVAADDLLAFIRLFICV